MVATTRHSANNGLPSAMAFPKLGPPSCVQMCSDTSTSCNATCLRRADRKASEPECETRTPEQCVRTRHFEYHSIPSRMLGSQEERRQTGRRRCAIDVLPARPNGPAIAIESETAFPLKKCDWRQPQRTRLPPLGARASCAVPSREHVRRGCRTCRTSRRG